MYCSRFAFLRVFNSETVEILHIAKLGFKKRMSIVLSKLLRLLLGLYGKFIVVYLNPTKLL